MLAAATPENPAAPRSRRRAVWAALALGLIALGLWGAYRHAVSSNAVALLDGIDRTLAGGDGAIRLAVATRYGADPQQKLEVFVPAGAAPPRPLPVVVFVHGGSWRNGDPHDYRFIARRFAPQGYVVVLAGYRLFPKVRYPAMLNDGAAALRWVHDHAAALGGDPQRLVLVGHSAGAYNAVMLALDPRWLAREGLSTDALRGVVGLAGPYDFYPFDSPAAIDSFGKARDPRDTQPVAHARRGAPPLLLVHGTADTRVRPRNAVRLARAMTAAGAPTQAVLLDGVSHEGILMQLARPFSVDARALDAVLPFLARVTASAPVQPAAANTPVP